MNLAVTRLFQFASLLSAALAFWVQPLLARSLLPVLGGVPTVWTACMLFFQTLLLLGYLAAHLALRRWPPATQAGWHLLALPLALPFLPFETPAAAARLATDGWQPLAVLLAGLLRTGGVPFLVLTMTAPVLQRWFAAIPGPAATPTDPAGGGPGDATADGPIVPPSAAATATDGPDREGAGREPVGHGRHRPLQDPYHLYAASNLGSLGALLAYPVLIEPCLTLSQQRLAWAAGYGLFALTMTATALVTRRLAGAGGDPTRPARCGECPVAATDCRRSGVPGRARMARRPRRGGAKRQFRAAQRGRTMPEAPGAASDRGELGWRREAPGARETTGLIGPPSGPVPVAIGSTDTERFTSSHPDHAGRWRWLLASFVPSSMVLAVTTHLTTDIAPVPLLWVIPLALYLLSFVVAFHAAPVPRGEPGESWGWRVGLPLFIAVWADEVRAPVWILASFHLGFCYLIGLACHRRLAADRPPVAELTRYYLYIAFGGVLGGFFNAILAPLLFHRSDELPLTVAAAAALLAWWPMRPGGSPVALTLGSSPPGGASTPPGIRRLRRLITLGAVITVGFLLRSRGRHAIDTSVGIALLLLVAVRAGRDRPRAISALGAAGLLAMLAVRPVDPHLLLRQRDFYGALEVTRTASDTARFLTHGNTFHGGQLTPFASRDVPLFYYHRDGPVGQVFEVVASRSRRLEIGVVGLGCGALAAYGRYGSRFTFYELDPKVVAIAEDPGLFTYLSDSKATIVVRTGDGRLGLADTATGTFDLLVIDAYNSDAIPVHLCTLEALDLYRSRLKPDGLLAVHLSHRFLDLESVFGALLWHRGMVGRSRTYRPTPVMPASGTPTFLDDHAASSCSWTVLANRVEDLGTLATDGRWRPVRWTRRSPLWTDDHQPLLMIYTWD